MRAKLVTSICQASRCSVTHTIVVRALGRVAVQRPGLIVIAGSQQGNVRYASNGARTNMPLKVMVPEQPYQKEH